MELEECRTGTRNVSEILESRGLREEDFYVSRARAVWLRKYTAQKVAEEMNAKFGAEIEVEEREMFMMTPNEMSEPDDMPEPSAPSQTPKEEDEE